MTILNLKRTITILLAVYAVFFRVNKGLAYEIVIVQASAASYYEKAVAGFIATAVDSVSKKGPQSAQPDAISRFYLSDRQGSELFRRRVSEHTPDLILAVGNRALEELKDYSDIPIVHLLAPGALKFKSSRSNITGIKMVVAPARQVAAFTEVLPTLKTVGVLYDPAHSASFIEESRAVAEMHGIFLVAEEVRDPKEVPALLSRFVEGVDALWMLPDSTVVTPVTVEAMLNFSFDNQIPLLTFADKYLKVGALVSVGFELFEMGEQAGRLARKVMASSSEKIAAAEFPEKVKVHLNDRIAAKMGLIVNTAALDVIVRD
jgi:putative ABC transport system substrate-binding protein